ncbi:threonine/serine exporter family protein [Clostridium folliculivorans]|uniref:Membrane protein n=1 Tax=Clostridium folliculivorans TaxID=2886038 RepID=A0A9W5XZM1_9CLOT|nr:threonine/serine exporter family protein [Clostridium folliculivorans]GKU23860.1 membrane protein [Clostridium folliculivorans]GKU29976.1 membrane protein [Clostridium folliculivorans]
MLFKETIAAFIATFGFGIIFNIKGKNLIFSSIGGMISWIIYKLALQKTGSDIAGLFISSIVFSAYSEACARILKTPVTTIVICALIPLVPGGGMYYTMYEAIRGDMNKSFQTLATTLASAGTLALGVIFVSTITRLISSARHRYMEIVDKNRRPY